jgi:hypothetical protein
MGIPIFSQNTVPTTGCRHALNWVIFNVAMEMGAPLSPEAYQAVTRADVYLRLMGRYTLGSVSSMLMCCAGTMVAA